MKQLQHLHSWLSDQPDWYETVLLMLFRLFVTVSVLVPVVYSTQLMYGISTTKHFFFRTIISILVLLYGLLLSHNRKYAPRVSWLTFGLVGIFLAYVLSSIVAGTAISSFWGNYLRMDGLLGWGYLLAYYLTLTQVLRDQDWWWILIATCMVGFWVALIAVSQYMGASIAVVSAGGVRSTATFGNAAYYAWYQVIIFFFLLLIWVQRQRKFFGAYALCLLLADSFIVLYYLWFDLVIHQASDIDYLFRNIFLLATTILVHWLAWRYWRSRKEVYRSVLLGLLSIISLAGLYASQSKAAWVAIPIGCLVIVISWLAGKRKFKFTVRTRRVLVTLIVVIVLTLVWQIAISHRPSSAIEFLTASKSYQDRALVWGAAWQAFKAKPLLGWGMDNFPVAFDRYYPTGLYDSAASPIWYDKAHSIYGQYAVEGGLLVLLGYLLVAWAVIRAAGRWTVGLLGVRSVLLGLVVAYGVVGLVYFDTIATAPLFFLMLAMIRQQAQPDQVNWLQSPIELLLPRAATTALIVLGSLLFWYNFTARQLITNWSYVRQVASVQKFMSSNDTLPLESLHAVVTNSPTLGKSDLRSQFASLMSDLIVVRPDDPDVRRFVPLVLADLQKNSGKRTNLVLPVVELANFTVIAGRIDPSYWKYGQDVVDRLLVAAPDRIQLYFLAGRLRILLGDAPAGLAFFQRAIDQRPMFDTYFNYYKQIVTLKSDQEIETFVRTYLHDYPIDERFQIVAFDLSMNQSQRALQHLKALAPDISQEPRDQTRTIAHWQRLTAVAYSQLGDNEKALTAARQSYLLDPITNGDLVNYFPQLRQ